MGTPGSPLILGMSVLLAHLMARMTIEKMAASPTNWSILMTG